MKPRKPLFDFAQALPHWSHHREFAQANNAASTSLPRLEPWLNRVMRMVREALPPDQGRFNGEIRKVVVEFK